MTDLKPPDMDGIAVSRAIRFAADADASGYLANPFSVSALTTLIKDVLENVDGTPH